MNRAPLPPTTEPPVRHPTMLGRGSRRGVLMYLAILGPGVIGALAGNDAGGIATYSSIGAAYGTSLLWALVIVGISLAIFQEMAARMGAVTGKGFADLVRENFGVRWTAFVMLTLLVANGGTTIAEFAGIAASAELIGISRFIAVPLMALLIWLTVTGGSYRTAERIFLVLSAVFVVYIITPFLTHPDWREVMRSTVVPTFQLDPPFLVAFITLVGTTISPYMQIFVQSAVVDKGVTPEEYRFERLDVLFGVIASLVVAFFIIVTTAATLHPAGIAVASAADAARALAPLAGPYAAMLFAIGLFGASMLAASILPLSTAYAISEAFGFERGISRSFAEAPAFNGLYTGLIVVGAGLVLIPNLPLIPVILLSQFVNGLLLPILLIFMLRLGRNHEILGDRVNPPLLQLAAWLITIVLIALSALLVIATLFPALL